jgi:hypothetical protein
MLEGSEGEIPVGRSGCRRNISIKVDAIEIGYDCVDWILSFLSEHC